MPRRMTDGEVVARAVMYAQMDAAERRPWSAPLVLQEQVRVMERIDRLERYLIHLGAVAADYREGHPRESVLYSRFIAAHNALRDIERTLPS